MFQIYFKLESAVDWLIPFRAESLASQQQENLGGRETLPSKGRGSLFKRKSARRAKSLGKDHWEEVIFCKWLFWRWC